MLGVLRSWAAQESIRAYQTLPVYHAIQTNSVQFQLTRSAFVLKEKSQDSYALPLMVAHLLLRMVE